MRETRVANRYAKALFELSLEMEILEEIRKDAVLITSVCDQNRDFVAMLNSPVIKDAKKLSILSAIFEKKINKLTYKFLVIITKNKREKLIAEICRQFVIIYREFKNIITAHLETAHEIEPSTRKDLLTLLEDQTKADIELSEEVREELIGGFILSFDNKQYDASIMRQIKNLRKEFDVNLYIKGF
ncbi:MAG: ATP synthase F1 subunit delta [Bacteroidales bacterium]|nr:ATP synthase F1 subunit delta [Bacteroidales bacterium]MCF8402881.1 ATP synthase F1 subunit delta [Bacteroidales bacterium]